MQLSKNILEAVYRGINIALDNFDYNDIQYQSHGKIKNISYTKDYIRWNELINHLENRISTKDEFNEIIDLHKKHGFMYKIIASNTPVQNALLSSRIGYIIGKYHDKGLNIYDADLNWIDVSNITSMSNLFSSCYFNGDISEWNVSNVKDMSSMFCQNKEFNKDISKWDVSNVDNFISMFQGAKHFNKNISDWNIKENARVAFMFAQCKIKPWNKPNFFRRIQP